MLGVLGGEQDLPIERLALARDQATLASLSHESCLKLWDLAHLKDSGSGEEDEDVHQEAAETNADVDVRVCISCYLVQCDSHWPLFP